MCERKHYIGVKTKHKTTRTEDHQPTAKTAELHNTRHPQEHNLKAKDTTAPAPSKSAADRKNRNNQERIHTQHQKRIKQRTEDKTKAKKETKPPTEEKHRK